MEYYLALKRNELSSHEKTLRKLKCILLSRRSQSGKDTYCFIQLYNILEKANCGDSKKIHGCKGLGKRECWISTAQRILEQWNYSVWYYSGVRGTTDWNHLPWPGKIVTSCMSYLTAGGPDKEHRTNKLPPTGKIQERSKGERRLQSIHPTNLPESSSLESILAEWQARYQEVPWVRVTRQRQFRN